VVAAGLMGVPVQRLTVTQWPLFVAALAGGVLFGLWGTRQVEAEATVRAQRRETLLLLLKSVWPILLVLGLSVVLKVDLILSLVVTLVLMVVTSRLGPARLWQTVRNTPLGIAPIIVGAMVFRRVLESSSAVEAISASLTELGIPLAVLVFVVPFVPGFLTGLAVAAFAIGFPIVFPLVGPDVVGSGYGLLAYTGGFLGLMLTPIHLCLSLTRTYFRAEWGGIYARMLPAAGLLVLVGAAVLLVRQ
jgi:uncharacterized protein